jgi:signal transduction histidine kinase
MSDRDLDRLTRLLGQCLDRLDARVARLFATATGDERLLARLDADAARLQELVGEILAHARQQARPVADLEGAVASAVHRLLDETSFPLIVRERRAGRLPAADCSPGDLEQAVRRSLDLAAAHAGCGGEILVTTFPTPKGAVLEVRCRGQGSAHVLQRASTLQEFVDAMQGTCTVTVDAAGEMLLSVELPAVVEPDGR